MWPIVANVPYVVSVSVCLLDIIMSCAKTYKRIQMLSVAWTRVGSKNHYQVGPGSPIGKSNFWDGRGGEGAHPAS